MKFLLVFTIAHTLLFLPIHNTTPNDAKRTIVLFEDELALVGYWYVVIEHANSEFKTLERSENILYCSEGKLILSENTGNTIDTLKDCMRKVLQVDDKDTKGSDNPHPYEPISIRYLISNAFKYDNEFDADMVNKNEEIIAHNFWYDTTDIGYKVKILILDELQMGFLNYVTNNIDTAKNDFFNRPILSLTPSHLLVVYEAIKREEYVAIGANNALADNILYPDRLNLASRINNCFGAKQFYQIYMTSLVAAAAAADKNQLNSPIILDYCSLATTEFYYEYEKELSNKCFNSELLAKLPQIARIKGEFDVVKCINSISKILEEYSIRTLSVVVVVDNGDKHPRMNIFDSIDLIGKPVEKTFIAMDMFSAYRFERFHNKKRLAHIIQKCADKSENKFQTTFPTNDEKCFALIYAATFLDLFTHKLGYNYQYYDSQNIWKGGAMFLDPAMRSDTRQHIKWVIAIVLLTVIALVSITTLVIVLMLEKRKSSRMNNQANSAIFLWNFPSK